MAVKIGSISISDAKIGTNSLSAIYVGNTKIWPESGPVPPTPTYKELTIENLTNTIIEVRISGDTIFTLNPNASRHYDFNESIPIGLQTEDQSNFDVYVNNVKITTISDHRQSIDIEDIVKESTLSCRP